MTIALFWCVKVKIFHIHVRVAVDATVELSLTFASLDQAMMKE